MKKTGVFITGWTAAKYAAGIGVLALSTQASALNIMLVNDDGCAAPGINALAETLQSRGHTITMYAPAGPQSGQGSRLTLPSGDCGVRFETLTSDLNGDEPTAGGYCVSAVSVSNGDDCGTVDHLPMPFLELGQRVSASPSDSAYVGLRLMDQAPDLVVSGINSGENVGSSTLHSGTVAAAVSSVQRDVPAIAVSLSVRSDNYAATAALVADVVEKLEDNAKGDALLPPGVALNINYPAGTPKGLLFTDAGPHSTLSIDLQPREDGTVSLDGYVFDFASQDLPAEQISEEGIAQREGYISISTLYASFNGPRAAKALTRVTLHGIGDAETD